jgi:hypothetical protein
VHTLHIALARDRHVRVYSVRRRVGGDIQFTLVRNIVHQQQQALPLHGVVSSGDGVVSPLVALKWVGPRHALALTANERLVLLPLLVGGGVGNEPSTGVEQQQRVPTQKTAGGGGPRQTAAVLVAEEEDVAAQCQLVFNTADFKGLATGGNVR